MIQKANLEFIHRGWTINFKDDTSSSDISSLSYRLRGLIISHIKTDEIDKFLRVLKQFYINNSKKLYTNLLDWMLANAVASPGDVKVKKEVFKHISEQTD